jgi:hypothetical protein
MLVKKLPVIVLLWTWSLMSLCALYKIPFSPSCGRVVGYSAVAMADAAKLNQGGQSENNIY